MNTTIDKLNGLKNTKQAIKQAIINKGVAVDEAATFASYATKIGEIQTGGGGEKGLPDIKFYPDQKFTSVKYCEWLWQQIKSIDWSDFNKLGITDMGSMFQNWAGQTLDIANLSTKGVTSMKSMFNNCSNILSLDVSHFDTSQVTNMYSMFNACYYITTLNFSNFDTSQVTNMYSMFGYCSRLLSLDLSSFNTSKVNTMEWMFSDCDKLTSLNLSSFDTSLVTTMGHMFNNCKSLTSVTWGNNWASNSSIDTFDLAGSASYNALAKFSHATILDLFNKLATRDNAPVLKLWNTVYDACTPEEIKIATDKGWTVTRVE